MPHRQRRYLIPFRATLLPQIFTDVLVVGAGVAGLRAALAAAERGADVIVAAKGELEQSSTAWAQGGIAAVLDPDDDTAHHLADTLTAGAGLVDEPVARRIVEGGPAAVRELAAWGMPFDAAGEPRDAPGMGDLGMPARLALGREGGHSHFRIVHSDGDATGRALVATLGRRVSEAEGVRSFMGCYVLDLLTDEGGRVLGAITHHDRHGLQVIWAGATVLAAGGCGQVFRESTNPGVATGDGHAMAWRAGAALRDMAFVQFHPTTLYIAGASRSLITEAVRGEGAHLVDRNGHRFMPDYDERAELAPRDVVSRSILQQMARTGHTHAYLDVSPIGTGRFVERFPGIAAMLKKFEIDPGQPIPVHPSAHYMIGGVEVDGSGATSSPGLFACGEAACSGLHGANRLASNSLLEGLVLGETVGQAAADAASAHGAHRTKIVSDIPLSDRTGLDLADVRSSLRSVMWRHVGIERTGEHLREVGDMFAFWSRYTLDKIFDDRAGWEVQNMLQVGALIARAAAWREESRGTHFRLDFPEPEESFRVHDRWLRSDDAPRREPVDAGDELSVREAPSVPAGRG
ncbi:L-aspartate oxidase [Phycisphaera mikurensis]|uniref:L-aspartate oxidase n=1 Tax=Phycisphaera mikurensis (strain NBRC 102666 / KCTC 22515 / FYK2301M01) TaxID=1142394 RepID=I0IGP8_PHYMF|nr:L-aspartate oxidase [Phycisphaera mikurensis]MBB6443227.1 L-aspartate oxidase [Phycisphaera mikurensis]BAM04436.1 L-aspartate oxidase [Phycisphaera mikurensis NBRC 102666]